MLCLWVKSQIGNQVQGESASMYMYKVARLLRFRQFSGVFLCRGVIQCKYISDMEPCKEDLKLTESFATNKERWNGVFCTATRYEPDDQGTECRGGTSCTMGTISFQGRN